MQVPRATQSSVHTGQNRVRGCPQRRLPHAGARIPEVPEPECSRPHLRHLDHVGELGEAGDGDDIVVGPTLGPGRRKQHR